jgi:hypothetical protein
VADRVTVEKPRGRRRWAVLAAVAIVLAATLFGGTQATWTDAEWALSAGNQVGRHNLQIKAAWADPWSDTGAAAGQADTVFEPGTGATVVTAPLATAHYLAPGESATQEWYLRIDAGMSSRVTLHLAEAAGAGDAALRDRLRFTVTTALREGDAWVDEQADVTGAAFADLAEATPVTLIAPGSNARDAGNAGQVYRVRVTMTLLDAATQVDTNNLQGLQLGLLNVFTATAVSG